MIQDELQAIQEVQTAAAPLDLQLLLLAGIFLSSLGVLALLGLLLARHREQAARLAKLEALDGIERRLAEFKPLSSENGEFDLRRVEHALIDLREGQKRFEERLLQVLEAAQARPALGTDYAPLAAPTGTHLAERVFGRLIALGYEQVQLVTPLEEISKLSQGGDVEGEIRVEARRSGAPHKGRVMVSQGVITDVQLQSVYSIFP